MSDATLEAWIAKLREAPRAAEAVALEAVDGVKRAAQATAEQGRTPDGVPWALSKTGGAVLRNAAKEVGATSIGSKILLTLHGHYARHHYGWVKGGARRQILPERLTEPIRTALKEAARAVMVRHFGG